MGLGDAGLQLPTLAQPQVGLKGPQGADIDMSDAPPAASERAYDGAVNDQRDETGADSIQTPGAVPQQTPRTRTARRSRTPSSDLSPTGC